MRQFLEVPCSGCGRVFQKLAAEVRRCQKHYCSPACYRAHVDYRALGAAAHTSPFRRLPSPEARFARSRAAGLARARNLSKEQLRAIALLAVKGRMEKVSPERRSEIARKNGATRRFGPALFGVRLGRSR